MGFDNGIYDFKNMCFRDGKPDDYISFTVGYKYKEYSENDTWVKEIYKYFESIQPDPETRHMLLTCFASYLSGIIGQQLWFMWIGGTGNNDRTLAIKLIRSVLGNDYSAVLDHKCFEYGKYNHLTRELKNKKGKRLLFMGEQFDIAMCETSERDTSDRDTYESDTSERDSSECDASEDECEISGMIKTVVGGDHYIYEKSDGSKSICKSQCKLLTVSNGLPFNASIYDIGVWRRLIIVPWESTFVDNPIKPNEYSRDMNLYNKIPKWRKRLVWILITKYYPIYAKNKIIISKKVRDYTSNCQNNIKEIQYM